ncbi:MAG: hypothetical protein J6K39_03480 [Clostridia bacterium]|nr:hypothetical protein [Clostridia bacterium]
MKYLLKTPFECLVKIGEKEYELDANNGLEIEDEERLFVYPLSSPPFYVNLKNLKENENYSILTHDDCTIILLEERKTLSISQKESFSFAGKACDVEICGNHICFETSDKKIAYTCPHPCKENKVFKIKDYACVQFDDHFYAYSIKNNKLTHFCGELSLNGNSLELKKIFHDSQNREKSATYNFEEDIVVENETFTSDYVCENPELTPYKLMESVKAKDFSCALNFLSENLKNSIDCDQIRSFFGNITTFLPLSTIEFITISANQKNFVRFNLADGKVDDITIDFL